MPISRDDFEKGDDFKKVLDFLEKNSDQAHTKEEVYLGMDMNIGEDTLEIILEAHIKERKVHAKTIDGTRYFLATKVKFM